MSCEAYSYGFYMSHTQGGGVSSEREKGQVYVAVKDLCFAGEPCKVDWRRSEIDRAKLSLYRNL
jgi:hypothetical protein